MAVLGRYAGVVDLLADLLDAAGFHVAHTWAWDRGDVWTDPAIGTAAAIVTLGPGDPSWARLSRAGWDGPTIAVIWHPVDELEGLGPTAADAVVTAGVISAELAGTVAALLHDRGLGEP